MSSTKVSLQAMTGPSLQAPGGAAIGRLDSKRAEKNIQGILKTQIHTQHFAFHIIVQFEMADDIQCVICLDALPHHLVATTQPCRHSCFDFDCLSSWLRQRPFCPLCKSFVSQVPLPSLTPHQAIPVYSPSIARRNPPSNGTLTLALQPPPSHLMKPLDSLGIDIIPLVGNDVDKAIHDGSTKHRPLSTRTLLIGAEKSIRASFTAAMSAQIGFHVSAISLL